MKKMNLVLIGMSSLILLLIIPLVTAVQLEHNNMDNKYLAGSSFGVEVQYENNFKPSNLKQISFPIALDSTANIEIFNNGESIWKDQIAGENYEFIDYEANMDLNIDRGTYKIIVTSDKRIKWALGDSSGKFFMIGKGNKKIEPKLRSKKYSFEHKLVFNVEDEQKPLTFVDWKIKNDKAEISFSCTDIGSGCKETYVKIGTADFTPLTYLKLREPATLFFHSIDNFGNIENDQSLELDFDFCKEKIKEGKWTNWYVYDELSETRHRYVEYENYDYTCNDYQKIREEEFRDRICEEDKIFGDWISGNCTDGTYLETKVDFYYHIDDVCDNSYNETFTKVKNC